MCKLTLVTGIPAVSTKMTVEHRGKENKGRQGTGCKAPHAGFCTGIAGIKFLLEAVCSASRQRTVGKRHKGVKQLGFPLLQHEPGEWNPILSPSLLTQTLASKPQHNSSQADWTQPEGSCGATEFVPLLHARPHLYKTHDSGACASYCHFHQAPETSFAFPCK